MSVIYISDINNTVNDIKNYISDMKKNLIRDIRNWNSRYQKFELVMSSYELLTSEIESKISKISISDIRKSNQWYQKLCLDMPMIQTDEIRNSK